MSTDNPTLSDILPAPARRVVYAVLGWAAAFSAIVVSALTDGFQWSDVSVLISGALVAAGFKMASANVGRS